MTGVMIIGISSGWGVAVAEAARAQAVRRKMDASRVVIMRFKVTPGNCVLLHK